MLKFLRNLFGLSGGKNEQAVELKPTPVYLGNIEELYPVPQSLPVVAPVEAEPVAELPEVEDDGFITVYPPVHADLSVDATESDADAGSEPAAVNGPTDSPVASGDRSSAASLPSYEGPDGREFPDDRPRVTGQRYGYVPVLHEGNQRTPDYRSTRREN